METLAESDRLVADLRVRIDAALATLFPQTQPADLYEPARFVLAGDGKRIRPILLSLVAQAYGATPDEALPAAMAVEVFHNFTLVHDDIMDGAATRRGRPTVHQKWNEPVAILSGDLLMGESYRLLAQTPRGNLRSLLACFSAMVEKLCEGQTLDMAFETHREVSVAAYRDMIARKTGALLEACLELGGRIGGANDNELETLRSTGFHIGQAFQMQDDLLDLTADHPSWGKPVGGDLVEGKKTFLLLRAIEEARGDEKTWFERIAIDKGLPVDLVPEARLRMERLGILDEAQREVDRHTDQGLAGIGVLPASPAREALYHLIERMARRSR